MAGGIGNIGQWAGMNSGIDHESLASNILFQAMNTVSRGGILRTRPGFDTIFNGPSGWPQGCKFFTTSDGISYFVFAVNGYVYASPYPFKEYSALPNIRFSPKSLHVTFEKCEQTTTYSDDGILEFLAKPLNVLVMQDGRTPAAYWDGSTSRHLNPIRSTGGFTEPGKDETPLGLWMAWANDRLWIFRDNQGFASDIGNPLKFTETQYLSEARAFLFPGEVTGAVQPYAGSPLVVFTTDTMTQLQCQIRDRTQWAETLNFQQTEDGIGCVAGKSIVKSFGSTWWFSEYGVVNLDFAMQTWNSSKFQYVDNAMSVSKAYLSPTLDRVCAAVYENYVLYSVPSGSINNRHTWVLDQINTPGQAAWDGYWTGIQPVEWATAKINGRQRIFALSYDADKVTRIWEAFQPDRNDGGCAITCMIETARYNKDTKNLKKYKNSRMFFDGLVGDSYISVRTASDHGPYNEVMNHKFVSTEGSIRDGYTDDIIDFIPQNRRLNTEYLYIDQSDCNDCGVETEDPNDIGTAFSHQIIWSGDVGLHGFQMVMEEGAVPSDFQPDCKDDETGDKIVTAAGCTSTDLDDVPDGQVVYTSEKTVTEECPTDPEITGTATVIRESIISQADADAKALCAGSVEADASMYECDNDDLPGEQPWVDPWIPPDPAEIDPWNFHTIETDWTGDTLDGQSLKMWYDNNALAIVGPSDPENDYTWNANNSPYNPKTAWGGFDDGLIGDGDDIISTPTIGDFHCVDLMQQYTLHDLFLNCGINQNSNGGDPPPDHGIRSIALYTAPEDARADGEKWNEATIPWTLHETFDWSSEWAGQVNGDYNRVEQSLALPVACRYIKLVIVDDWVSHGDASNPIVRIARFGFNVQITEQSQNEIEYTRNRYDCEMSDFSVFPDNWFFEEVTGLAGECSNDNGGTNQCKDAIDATYPDSYRTPNGMDDDPMDFQWETAEEPVLMSRLMFVGNWLDPADQPTNLKLWYKGPDDDTWQYYRHFRFPFNTTGPPGTYGVHGEDFMTAQQSLFGGSNQANKSFHLPVPQGWYKAWRIEAWLDVGDPQFGSMRWWISSIYYANRWVIADGEDTNMPPVANPQYNFLGGFWDQSESWSAATSYGTRGFIGTSDGTSAMSIYRELSPWFGGRKIRVEFDVDVLTGGVAEFEWVDRLTWASGYGNGVGTYSNLVGVTEPVPSRIQITTTGSKSFDVEIPAKVNNYQFPSFFFDSSGEQIEINNFRITYLDV